MATKCQFCPDQAHPNETKYKCPQCLLGYCSLACFKAENHQLLHTNPPQTSISSQAESTSSPILAHNSPSARQPNPPAIPVAATDSAWARIASDPIIRAMLHEDALQFHLLTLVQIANDPNLGQNRSGSADDRHTLMNLKLNDLRTGGIEENALVEEFIGRVLQLHSETP